MTTQVSASIKFSVEVCVILGFVSNDVNRFKQTQHWYLELSLFHSSSSLEESSSLPSKSFSWTDININNIFRNLPLNRALRCDLNQSEADSRDCGTSEWTSELGVSSPSSHDRSMNSSVSPWPWPWPCARLAAGGSSSESSWRDRWDRLNSSDKHS